MKRIDFFDGTAHDFLSNFHVAKPIAYDGQLWKTTEHAFQAMKTLSHAHRKRVRLAKGPGAAKGLGQRLAFERYGVAMVPDWESAKYRVMLDLLRIKFRQPTMRTLLLSTGTAELIEGNTWGDTCWGVEYYPRQNGRLGVGENHLGRQLMRVRGEVRGLAKLWHVTGIGVSGHYVRTVECKTLNGVRRAAEKLAREIGYGRSNLDERVAVLLGHLSGSHREYVGGGYVEVERVV